MRELPLRVDIISPDGILIDTQTLGRRPRYTSRLLFAGRYRVELRGPQKVLLAARYVDVRLGEVTRCDFDVEAVPPEGASPGSSPHP